MLNATMKDQVLVSSETIEKLFRQEHTDESQYIPTGWIGTTDRKAAIRAFSANRFPVTLFNGPDVQVRGLHSHEVASFKITLDSTGTMVRGYRKSPEDMFQCEVIWKIFEQNEHKELIVNFSPPDVIELGAGYVPTAYEEELADLLENHPAERAA